MEKGWVFDIQRYCVNDGPGIRTSVFFKGCPLHCPWCDNPESQNSYPELLYFETLCIRCYRCVEACPNKATKISPNGSLEIIRELCKACGRCVKVCPSEARAISGKLTTVDQVLGVVKKDSLFYRNSGGGITASGGEPTYQPDFLLELLKKCQEGGLDTAIETCGYVRWEVLQTILEYVDLVLFDIKCMDSLRHRELTGVGNELILQNANSIIQERKSLIIRMPLIREVNDSAENIKAAGKFMSEIGVQKVELVPYHELGTKKYERLGRKYKLSEMKLYHREEIDIFQQELESYGLACTIA